MPCQILHSWHNEVEDGCSVPLLHMGKCVAKELKEEKFRPIEAGSPIRIGVLATNATLAASVYQDKLEHELSDMQGFEVVLPDKATMEHTVIPALDALSRKDFEGAQNLFRIALQVLLVRAVNRIILASDELRQLLPPDDPLWMKCIDRWMLWPGQQSSMLKQQGEVNDKDNLGGEVLVRYAFHQLLSLFLVVSVN
ncbi:UNVERIFIED_CONTAM: hypothetical protein Scaly_0157700 [Sesamum calycinum]|uniref:Uncharacterized protein n=1 Tax=Sesamum calycinum TaxID=2727403 RepID=A0AAW2SXD6_9LAMI